MPKLTIAGVIDRARELHDLKSDYALCKALNCSTQLVANWRHGRTLPDEKSCQALAALAEVDPDVLIAEMNAQRAKDDTTRAIWERIAERLQSAAHGLAAAFFAVAVSTFLIAQDAEAAALSGAHHFAAGEVNSLYIVSSLEGLICVILLWLAARFDPTFRPCFVPAK